MSRDRAKNEKKSGELQPVFLVLVLVLAAVLVILSLNGNIGQKLISKVRNAGPREVATDCFYFSPGKDPVFADVSGGLACASGSGLQVYDRTGAQTVNELFMMESPAIMSKNGRGVAYDIGGRELRMFDGSQVIFRLTSEDPIISAEISESGRFAVCTGDSGYKGRVTVYSETGDELFRWYSGEGYVLSAALPASGNELAVLTVTERGSRIVRLHTDDEEYLVSTELPGELLIDAAFTRKNAIAAIGETAFYVIKEDGDPVKTDFGGKYLRAYVLGEELNAAVLMDYRSGFAGQLTVFSDKGEETASCEVRDLIALSSAGRYAAVLTNDSLTVYDSSLYRVGSYRVSGFSDVIMRTDGTVAAAAENYAENFAGNGD